MECPEKDRFPDGKVWAYARVSTRDQNPQLRLVALEADGYDDPVMEEESRKCGTARLDREELRTKPVAGGTLKFWKSDRWGASRDTYSPR